MTQTLEPGLWTKIGADPLIEGVVLRRVLPDLPHDVFIGETRPSRNRVLELSVVGVPENMPKKWRQSKGLEVVIDSSDPTRTKVRLRSMTSLGDPLFGELASDLVDTLAAFPGPEAASRVVERVLSWQAFFAQAGETFSADRAAGLFGELTVLGGTLLPELGPPTTVHGWTGPDPAIQDFQFQDVAVEVKTYRGTGAGRMTISSERQLEHVGVSHLYLAYVALDQRQDGAGRTMLELVDDIRADLADTPAARHLFDGKLISCGWRDAYAEYRDERYTVRDIEFFLVRDDFPRLVESGMPTGISAVSYLLERSALDHYLVESETMTEHLRTKK